VVIATGAQRVRKIDEKTLRVTVDTTSRDAAPDTDATNPAFLASTALADLRDARIVALRSEALKDAPEEPEKRAEVLRRFVYRYITNKSMNVAYASASETARTREGDCTEHAVLLATLLRADHIPARVVGGLIYADEFAGGQHIFGYHMWAQALLELDGAKRWVDLDGAISPTIAFDATHIAVATSDLADGDNVGALVSLAPMLGRLRIKIESVGPIPDAAPSQGKADGKEKK
jgi:transglutaminase-like putative cysteine protease